MSELTLYQNTASPYVRKVLMVLHETGQIADVTLKTASGSPLDSSGMPLAENPLGKVPVLARNDGPALYDSRVICRYLDDRAQGGLYPTGAAQWPVLTLEATAEGILDAALQIVYEARLRPEDKRAPDVVEGQWKKVERALQAIDRLWVSHLAGPVDISHLSVATALGYLDFRLDARQWRTLAPDLATWIEGFSTRPSYQETRPASL